MRSAATLYLSLVVAVSMLLVAVFAQLWWIWAPALVVGTAAAVIVARELRKPSDQHGPPGQH